MRLKLNLKLPRLKCDAKLRRFNHDSGPKEFLLFDDASASSGQLAGGGISGPARLMHGVMQASAIHGCWLTIGMATLMAIACEVIEPRHRAVSMVRAGAFFRLVAERGPIAALIVPPCPTAIRPCRHVRR